GKRMRGGKGSGGSPGATVSATAVGCASSLLPKRNNSRSQLCDSGLPNYDLPAVAAQEITCLIVDDHEVVREGLRLSLSRAPHIRGIGEAADGEAAVALAERRRPRGRIMDRP